MPEATSLAGLLTDSPPIPISPGTLLGPVSETALARMAHWHDTLTDRRHSSDYAPLTREWALTWIADWHAQAGTENSEDINGPRAFYIAWHLCFGYSVLESCFMASRRLHERASTLQTDYYTYAPLDESMPGATDTSEAAQARRSLTMPNSNPIGEDGYPSSAARYGARLAENIVQAMANAPDATSLAGLLTEQFTGAVLDADGALIDFAQYGLRADSMRLSSQYMLNALERLRPGYDAPTSLAARALALWRVTPINDIEEHSAFLTLLCTSDIPPGEEREGLLASIEDATVHMRSREAQRLARVESERIAASESKEAAPEEETEEEEEPAYIGENEEGDSITQEDADAGAGRGYTWSERQECYIRDRNVCNCEDDDSSISSRYRRENCYRSDDGTWFADEERRDERNRESEDNADLYDSTENVLSHFPKTWARDALVFGVELEMEGDGASASAVIDALGGDIKGDRFILKTDGSLDDSGVELVSVPMSLDAHRKYWGDILTARLHAVAHSGEGTSSCGMHVHINRGALSPLTLGKMLVMANSESPNMVRIMETVSQRRMCSWAKRSAKKFTDGKSAESDDRYEVINISGRHPTAEVRMFRGNLRAERVIKNVEFCHALVTYCKDTSLRYVEDAPRFATWLVKNRHHYPMLVKFLADKGVIELPTLTLTAPPSDAPTISEEI